MKKFLIICVMLIVSSFMFMGCNKITIENTSQYAIQKSEVSNVHQNPDIEKN